MTYKPGDVVLVGFPFTSLSATKKRPAVVISSQNYQTSRPDIILLAITSQVRQPLGFGEGLISDWQDAGLLKPSVFKPLIATVEQSLVIRLMGQLTHRDQQSLQRILQQLFSSSPAFPE